MVDHRFVDLYGAKRDLERAVEALTSASKKLYEYDTWCETPLLGCWASMLGGLADTVDAITTEIGEYEPADDVRGEVPQVRLS